MGPTISRPGPHIVDAGGHSSEHGHQVHLLQRDQQTGQHEDGHIHRQKQIDAPDVPLAEGLPLKADGRHRIGVEHPPHLPDGRLL